MKKEKFVYVPSNEEYFDSNETYDSVEELINCLRKDFIEEKKYAMEGVDCSFEELIEEYPTELSLGVTVGVLRTFHDSDDFENAFNKIQDVVIHEIDNARDNFNDACDNPLRGCYLENAEFIKKAMKENIENDYIMDTIGEYDFVADKWDKIYDKKYINNYGKE